MCLESLELCKWILVAYLFSYTMGLKATIDDGANEGLLSTKTEGGSAVNLKTLTLEDKKKFLDSFDTVITDCDGVLYNKKGAIQNAHRTVDELRKQGKKIYFVSNSTRTTALLMKRFKEFGFTNITDDSIISSGSLLVNYLRENLPPEALVYVIGPTFVCDELQNYDIRCFGPGKDEMDENLVENIVLTDIELRDEVGAVVVGFDIYINYLKILKAFTYLKNENCLFIAMNTDETFISVVGTLLPSTGVIVAAIKAASGREPFIMGKPGNHLIEVLRNLNDPTRTLYIGDKLNADIFLGHKCSFKTLFVLSGVNSLKDMEKYTRSKDEEERQMYVPDYYTEAFSDLLLK